MALSNLLTRLKNGGAPDAPSTIKAHPITDPLAPPPVTVYPSTHPITTLLAQEGPKVASKRYATFGELPKFIRVLTQGEHAVYRLPHSNASSILAIELEGRIAIVLASEELPPDRPLHNSLGGALTTAGFSVQPIALAPQNVLDEVRACVQGDDLKSSRYANPHMATVKTWLTYAVEHRATDIHIEINGSAGQVRFRIDGELESMRSPGGGVYASRHVEDCLAALYNNEQQRKSGSDSLFDASKNLYCMVPYNSVPGHTLKLRYQSLRGNDGPKVILRLLHVNEEQTTLSFEQLGYAPSHIALWENAMQTPSGAILISGITGSGKSTTQKSFIELNPAAPASAIYTIEDPVEYPIRYAHQYPIQRDLSDPAASARLYTETVAALMRADPDVVMLGEVRDEPSARALQQLVETGHMGLATVHAHLLSGIIPRLTNPEVGLSRDVLTAPNMLTLLVYQALVPKLCPACSATTAEAMITHPEVAKTVAHFATLDLPTKPMRWRRMGGCKHCAHRGTIGLTVVAEMHMPDEDWLAAIRARDDTHAVEIYRSYSDGNLASFNMAGKTVFEHALWKALQGHIDARQCTRFDSFARYIARLQRLRSHLAHLQTPGASP